MIGSYGCQSEEVWSMVGSGADQSENSYYRLQKCFGLAFSGTRGKGHQRRFQDEMRDWPPKRLGQRKATALFDLAP